MGKGDSMFEDLRTGRDVVFKITEFSGKSAKCKTA
jgi:hypothetical protein